MKNKKSYKEIITSYLQKIANIPNSLLIFYLVIFILFISANIHSDKFNSLDKTSLDPGWMHTIENIRYEDSGILGKDLFFTYGPLSQYFHPAENNIHRPLVHNITSNLFLIFNFSILILLLIRISKYRNYSLILLAVPMLPWLMIDKLLKYETMVLVIAFLVIYIYNNKKTKLNFPAVILLALYSGLFLLFKFNIGIYLLTIFPALIITKNFHSKKICLILLLTFSSVSTIFIFIIFAFLTHTLNILPYIYNSLVISMQYKEYMALEDLTRYSYITSVITLIGFIIPIFYLKKKTLIPFFVLVYFAFVNGWTRHDKHVLETTLIIFFITCISAYTLINQKYLFQICVGLKNKLALIIIILALIGCYFNYSAFGVNLTDFNFKGTAFSDPIFTSQNTTHYYALDSNNIRNSVGSGFISNLNKSNKILVLPWGNHLSDVFDKDRIYLPYLQMYQSYTPEAERLSETILEENYNDTNLLIHAFAIDNRLYFSEMPNFTLDILKNYQYINYDNELLLLGKKNQPFQQVQCIETQNLEETNFMQIYIEETLFEEIKAKVFKPTEICINITNQNNDVITKRVYDSQLKRGIIIDPVLTNVEDLKKYFYDNTSNRMISYSITYCNTSRSLPIIQEKYYKCDI